MEGGKWVVTIPVEEDLEEELESSWLLMIANIIGSNIEQKYYDNINGIIYAVRDKY